MKSKKLRQMQPLLTAEYGKERALQVSDLAQEYFDRLCSEHAADSKAVKAQTEENLYPCFALYRAL